MQKKKRFLALLLALVVALPFIQSPLTAQAAGEGSVTRKITVVKGKDINDIQYDGKNVLHSSAWWYDEDGTKNPAFCVDPKLAGPGEIAAGKYDVNVTGAETNEKIAAILNNSIPYKTYQELGVANEEEAYAATKAAIWCVIGVSKYTDQSHWKSAGNPKVQDLFNKLVNLAQNNPEPVKQAVYGSAKVDKEPVLDGDYYYQRFKIAETSNSGKSVQKYTVKLTGNYPKGTKITDEGGAEKNSFKGDELFAIRIPKSAVPGNGNVEANVEITATLFSNVILIGKPLNGLDGKVQDMEIAMPYQNVVIKTKMTMGQTEVEPDPSGSGKLTVIKLDARDNATPLAGVTFDCYNSNGQLVDTGTTDKSGKWIPKISKAGTYTVIERSTNNKYQLTEPTTLVITVPTDNDVTATFRDYPSQTVTMEKEDAVTGKPVPGCEYEIIQIDGKGVWRATGKTDASGKISWNDVPDGTYLVREVSTTDGYILDQTPQYVTVRNGQAPSLKFLDSKYPGLTITKVDKQTGEIIKSAATFRIEQIDGSYSTDVTTTNGVATIKNIPVGSYKITEKSAPEGYVVANCPDSVYIGKDESKQIIVYNAKKPVLTIEKIDGATGNAIPGTKFEIKKSDGTKIGTVETGKDGKVTVGMKGGELGYLEPGTYTVTEVFVPAPYVLSNEHQDIKLEAGDTKTLLFANLEKPKITVEKYDEKTGEKLAGAQFAIYEQSDLSRPVAEGMTDANGKFSSGYIAPGTYVVSELNPPSGYMFSDKTKPERTIVAKAGDGEIIVKVDNIKLPQLTIKKVDSVTKAPIANVTYEVKMVDDTSVLPATATTDKNGVITIPGLKEGTYEIKEISTPKPYILNSTPQRVKLVGGDEKTLLFENTKYPTLIIQKTDGTTNKGIPNTTYLIEHEKADGSTETVGTYKTDAKGRIKLPYVETGWYVITETKPAQGYQKPTNPVTRIYLKAGDNSYTATENVANSNSNKNNNPPTTGTIVVTSGADYEKVGDIVNYPLNSLVIKKSDANTGKMLEGAIFEVIKTTGETSGQNGKVICTVTTDHSGVVVITGLEAGAYAVREIKAPTNYIIDETDLQTVNLKADGTSVVEVVFRNYPYGAISINKTDGDTKQPLEGAEFTVKTSSGAAVGDGRYVTDANGNILIPDLAPGSYVITEVKAPDDYVLTTTPQTIQIGTTGETKTVNFTNYKKGGIIIRKFDADNKELLAGATFKVERSDGTVVGTSNGLFTTDESGMIKLPTLEKGTYVITETKAPDGYALSDNPSQTIKIDNTKTYTVDFYNHKQLGVQIIKIDSDTKQPLKGAEFQIWNTGASGSTSVSGGTPAGTLVGTYTTDNNGVINVVLPAGTYEILETKAPEGYQIDRHKQDIVVKDGKQTSVTFTNTKILGLEIIKQDADTKKLLQGATFEITKVNGEKVGTYNTDSNGHIMVSDLKSDTYVITEKTAPAGYVLDSTPQTVTVKAGKVTTVTFTNRKKGGVVIQKLDSATEKPIEGCKFLITTFDGDTVGTFETDRSGQIHLPNLADGTYIAKEIKAPSGYNLAQPKTFKVSSGQNSYLEGASNQKTITIYNDPLGVSQIIKTDSVTGKPVAGATYVIAALNNGTGRFSQTVIAAGPNAPNTMVNGLTTIIGRFKTSENGIINISNLPEGWYTLQEESAPEGYERDTTIYNFQITGNGKPTIIQLTNKPIMGRIALTKLSANYNNNTGWDSGTPLAGAVYSVLDKDGVEVDRLTTGADGTAISNNLKIGTYYLKEVKAPDWYGINPNNIAVTLKKQGQVVSVTAKDSSVNLMVGIKKTSDTKTCSAGDTINYYITGVGNESNVSLDNFTVHDKLPDPKAAQIKYLDTGMWNIKYNFKVAYTTNKNTAYTYLPGIYSSDRHNHIDLYAGNMGLRSGEYVTQVKLEFQGSVAPGFKLMEAMSMQMIAGNNYTNGYQFTNYADVSGRWHGQIVTANSHWTIKMYGNPRKLPKTGW